MGLTEARENGCLAHLLVTNHHQLHALILLRTGWPMEKKRNKQSRMRVSDIYHKLSKILHNTFTNFLKCSKVVR